MNFAYRINVMNIMFAVPCYWPSQDGVTQITKYLAEGLAQRGHEVLVYTSTGNGGLQVLPEKESYGGVTIERTRVDVRWPMYLKGRDENSTREKYYDRICSFAPDVLVVVCAQTWTLDWVVPYLNRIKCVKVFYSHGYSRFGQTHLIVDKLRHRNILGAYEEWRVKKYYERLHHVVSKFDLAVYLSKLNSSYLYAQENRLFNGKVLENAIEDAFVTEDMCHTEEFFKRDRIQYLYVANYNDNKNQDMLLKAFCEAEIENAVLQFAGFEENDYLAMLRKHVSMWLSPHSDKKVIFNVHLSREEIYKLYKESDVFVCTSRSENCPIVHCEAAAAGMAVISTDVGDVRLKDGIILVEDVVQLKEAMERLYADRDELYERGARLRAYMLGRKCRVQDKVDWLESELDKLCHNATRSM